VLKNEITKSQERKARHPSSNNKPKQSADNFATLNQEYVTHAGQI